MTSITFTPSLADSFDVLNDTANPTSKAVPMSKRTHVIESSIIAAVTDCNALTTIKLNVVEATRSRV